MTPQKQRIKQLLLDNNLDGLIISNVFNIQYLTAYSNFSLYERECYLLIAKDINYLFTDGRYTEAVKKQVIDFDVIEKSSDQNLEEAVIKIAEKNSYQNVGFEGEDLKYSEYQKLSKKILRLKSINLNKLRLIKETKEIELVREACQLGDEAFSFVLNKIKEGISEKELALELELFIKRSGGDLSFDSIVGFGEHSSVPHHQTGQTKLSKKDGKLVLLDMGVKLDGYCSDMTRTIFFGKPSKRNLDIYNIVLEAQQEVVDYIKLQLKKGDPIEAKDADLAARNHIIKKGYPSIPHGVGHGIGLEVHEAPRLSNFSDDLLEEGMVFSIEPGVYISGYGGVRIEDLFAIQKGQLLQLTSSSKTATCL